MCLLGKEQNYNELDVLNIVVCGYFIFNSSFIFKKVNNFPSNKLPKQRTCSDTGLHYLVHFASFLQTVAEIFVDIPYDTVLDICNATVTTDVQDLLKDCAGVDSKSTNLYQYGSSSILIDILTRQYQMILWQQLGVTSETRHTIRQLALGSQLNLAMTPFLNADTNSNVVCDAGAALAQGIFSSERHSNKYGLLILLGVASMDPMHKLHQTGLYEVVGEEKMSMKDIQNATLLDMASILQFRGQSKEDIEKRMTLSRISYFLKKCQQDRQLSENELSMEKRTLQDILYNDCRYENKYLKFAVGPVPHNLSLEMTIDEDDKDSVMDLDVFSLFYRSSKYHDRLLSSITSKNIQELATMTGLDKPTTMSLPFKQLGSKLFPHVSEEAFIRYIGINESETNTSASLREILKPKFEKLGQNFNEQVILTSKFQHLFPSIQDSERKTDIIRLLGLPLAKVLSIMQSNEKEVASKTIIEFMKELFAVDEMDTVNLFQTGLNLEKLDVFYLKNFTIRMVLQMSKRTRPDGDIQKISLLDLYTANEQNAFKDITKHLFAPIKEMNNGTDTLQRVLLTLPKNTTTSRIREFFTAYYGAPFDKKEFTEMLFSTDFSSLSQKIKISTKDIQDMDMMSLAEVYDISELMFN